jgi:hypothetical protein
VAKLIDLIGRRFGRLVVSHIIPNPKKTTKSGKIRTGAWWECLCDCGVTKSFSAHNLLSGNSTSCGCLHKEALSERSKLLMTEPPWVADMKVYRRKVISRANNPKSKLGSNQFSKEGGKSKEIAWNLTLEDYVSLVTGDCFYCGARPSQIPKGRVMERLGLLRNGIDRVDNTLGYEVGNCVSCCVVCNRDKRNSTQMEFVLHTEKRYLHLIKLGLLPGQVVV